MFFHFVILIRECKLALLLERKAPFVIILGIVKRCGLLVLEVLLVAGLNLTGFLSLNLCLHDRLDLTNLFLGVDLQLSLEIPDQIRLLIYVLEIWHVPILQELAVHVLEQQLVEDLGLLGRLMPAEWQLLPSCVEYAQGRCDLLVPARAIVRHHPSLVW